MSIKDYKILFAMGRIARARHDRRSRAFTLVELLAVLAIVSLLTALLLPVIKRARLAAETTACRANLRTIGQALLMYESANKGHVIASYAMTGTIGGPDVPLEGWASILDRDGYIKGKRHDPRSVFSCPSMIDVEAMRDGQTGSDPFKPRGWMDWPNVRTGSGNSPAIIPARGFDRIIRVAYWINAENHIGSQDVVHHDLHYTSSVGYGPDKNGLTMQYTRSVRFKKPSQLVALADGVYAGRQRDTRLGVANIRIGYRHPGRTATANTLFADRHVDAIEGDQFPRGLGGTNRLEDVRADNLGAGPTLYANPESALRNP